MKHFNPEKRAWLPCRAKNLESCRYGEASRRELARLERTSSPTGAPAHASATAQHPSLKHHPKLLSLDESTVGVLKVLRQSGARPLVVGGAVRDALLGETKPKDVDIEVYGMGSMGQLAATLAPHGRADLVGKSYGVVKFFPQGKGAMDLDISLPRRDSKTGEGHRDFSVEVDPTMTMEEAFARRDYTLNALGYDYGTSTIVDHYGGVEDLKNGVLRHTSEAFAEDPLRVLRGVQFAGRYNLRFHPSTALLARGLATDKIYDSLPRERIWGEWSKLLRRGERMERSLEALRDSGWDRLYPGLKKLQEGATKRGVSLGAVGAATLRQARAQGLSGEATEALVLASFVQASGTPTERRERVTRELLQEVGAPPSLAKTVVPLARESVIEPFAGEAPSDASLRGLARRLTPAKLQDWFVIARATSGSQKALEEAHGRAGELDVLERPQERLLRGEDLMAQGLKPGPQFREHLDASLRAQDDGTFGTHGEAVAWLRSRLGTE